MLNLRAAIRMTIPLLFILILASAACGSARPADLPPPNQNQPYSAATAAATCIPERMPIPDARRLELILSCLDDIKAQNHRVIEQNSEIITLLQQIRDRLPQ